MNSRSKQLKWYTGNWATFEVLKTLLKNRRVYRNRIGLQDNNDNDNAVDLKDSEGEGDVDLKDGNNLGS